LPYSQSFSSVGNRQKSELAARKSGNLDSPPSSFADGGIGPIRDRIDAYRARIARGNNGPYRQARKLKGDR